MAIPNATLASAIVSNYNLLDGELAVQAQVSISYKRNLEKVERMTVEFAREVTKGVQCSVRGFEPFFGYRSVADFRIDFTVTSVPIVPDRGLGGPPVTRLRGPSVMSSVRGRVVH